MLEAPSEYCSVSPQVGRRKPDVSGAETNIKGGVSFKNCTEHEHFILPCDDKIPGFQIISLMESIQSHFTRLKSTARNLAYFLGLGQHATSFGKLKPVRKAATLHDCPVKNLKENGAQLCLCFSQ